MAAVASAVGIVGISQAAAGISRSIKAGVLPLSGSPLESCFGLGIVRNVITPFSAAQPPPFPPLCPLYRPLNSLPAPPLIIRIQRSRERVGAIIPRLSPLSATETVGC
ncbi:hypothetical protein FQN51_004251 [Onygenales sp. PD_10]|nr:hypothetical protein FQN51_004251 [Onygenales sp. PD_10]